MKRFIIPFLSLIALPSSLEANVDPKVFERCMKAVDFEGCVKSISSQKKDFKKDVKKKKGWNIFPFSQKEVQQNSTELITVNRNAMNSHTFLMRIPIIRTVTVRVRRATYLSKRSSTKQINKFDESYLYFDKGLAKEKLGDYKSAIREYDNAININSNDPDFYYFRGWAKARREVRDLKGAISDLEKLNLIEPNQINNILDLATIYAKSGRFDDAIDLTDKALQIDSDNGNIIFWRGIYKIVNNNYSGGCKDVKIAQRMNASDYKVTMKRTCN